MPRPTLGLTPSRGGGGGGVWLLSGEGRARAADRRLAATATAALIKEALRTRHLQ